MKKRYLLLAIILALLPSTLVLTACASSGAVNSLNTVDRQLYETLYVAQAAIEQAKLEATGASPAVRAQITSAINNYNDAYEAYVAFHTALAAGTATDATSVHDRVVALIHEIAELRAALNHKEGPS